MTEALPDFRLHRPESLEELAALWRAEPQARVFGGGTDIIPNLRRGLVDAPALIELGALPGFADLTLLPDGGLRLGAGLRLADLASETELAGGWRALAEAARAVAGPAHRNAATLGGNLCQDTRCLYYNQSDWWRAANGYCLKYRGDTCHVAPQGSRCRAAFCSDLAPALIALGAEAELAGPGGTRQIALLALYRDDGAAHLALGPGELLVAVHLPAFAGVSGYEKMRVRRGVDFPLAGVGAALAPVAGGWALRVAVSGTDSLPVAITGLPSPLALPLAAAVIEQIDKAVQKQVTPMRSTMVSSHYRRLAAAALARRLVQRLAREAAAA
ncbi:MAG: 4-hydroxybenzoyl-CoA reductase subunit beta [Alphaproteobacteria bacterium HGW-Alphaproteobacteria-2]|nr:MAG: 4-hydroxybenzoyl-CoA reductase subunit beta [Alphaproteobacteria bacterium HGW-Alphaproteobacteria-2]